VRSEDRKRFLCHRGRVTPLWPVSWILCLVLLFLTSTSDAKVYLDITSPGLRRLPISIIARGPREAEVVQGIVKDDLYYTGLFSDVPPDIPGAEIRVEIEVKASERLESIVNVTDMIEGRGLLKKRYEASPRIIRALAHSISNDIFEVVTGRKGAFRTRIAYIQISRGKREIYLMDWDGHNPRPLISGGLISSHHWSMDGRYIVYSSERGRRWRIYLVDLERYKKDLLFQSKGLNLVGNISRNGQVVFSSSKDGSPEIYIMDIRTKGYRKLTHSYGIDVSPVLSPDGTKIAFVSDRGGTPQIYVMDIQSRELNRITFNGNYNTSPAWSPDGEWIAYTGRVNGKNQIFVVKSDGTELRQLTDTGNNEEPSFSPDGLFIAFDSDREGRWGVYVMRINGEGQRRISPDGVVARSPEWSPYKE
jgi:TolB protein